MGIFDWAQPGVLRKKYETNKVRSLISKIKIDEPEKNWIYIQLIDQFCTEDIRLLKKAFRIEDDPYCMELASQILMYKKRSKKHG